MAGILDILHKNTKNEIGKTFGRLTVLSKANNIHYANRKVVAWLCKCICGKETIKPGSHLRKGTVKSCGCLALESQKKLGKINQKYGTNRIRKYPQPSANWLSGLMNRHQISPKAWTLLILKSEGRCDICLEPFKNTSQNLNVDHNHMTGKVRGLLCSRCNGMLSGLEDKEFCVKATLYLQKDGE